MASALPFGGKMKRTQIYERIYTGDLEKFILSRPGVYKRGSDGAEFNVVKLRRYYTFIGFEKRKRTKREFQTNINGFKVAR